MRSQSERAALTQVNAHRVSLSPQRVTQSLLVKCCDDATVERNRYTRRIRVFIASCVIAKKNLEGADLISCFGMGSYEQDGSVTPKQGRGMLAR